MSRCCAVVPVFDHADTVATVVDALRQNGLFVIIVDDGSGELCAGALAALSDAAPDSVALLRLARNSGKGAAVSTGIGDAARRGFTHALQIDADAQHDLDDIPRFLETSSSAPDAVVTGVARYGDDVPRARYYGRLVTHAWVYVHTLSFDIRDSMCGFRVYPLAPLVELMEQERIGPRMEFDTEVLVRLAWRGVRVVNIPTRVCYRDDGVSHFRMWSDNWRIAWMHTRLFFGMLRRLPARRRRFGRPLGTRSER